MSACIETPFALMHGKGAGQNCWIVGSGPSLDVLPWKNIPKEDYVFCLNASITLFMDIGRFPNAWWFYRDRRICREIGTRLNPWRRFKIFTTRKGFLQARDCRLLHMKNVQAVIYEDKALIHERTVVEDALQLIRDMGFSECTLVGIDHCVVNGVPYAKDLMWKDCHFYSNKGNEQPEFQPIEAMIKSMENIKPKLGDLRVFNASPYYPREVFPARSIEESCKLVAK